LNCKAATCVFAWRMSMVVMVEVLNCAMSVAVGSVLVVQLVVGPAAVKFQSLLTGFAFQASAGGAPALRLERPRGRYRQGSRTSRRKKRR
jgi:hypothetical protein